MGELERDIAQLETLLRKLEKEYEMFLCGQLRREPTATEGAVQSLIKTWTNRSIQNSAQAFRVNSLAARYNSFRTVWSRRLREKEEGRGTAVAKAPAAQPKPAAAAEGPVEYIARGPEPDAKALERLFEAYRGLREKAGESTARLTPESFRKALAEKIQKLRREHGAETVLLRVVGDEGRARIVARTLRGGKST